jgi:hypothetical protein
VIVGRQEDAECIVIRIIRTVIAAASTVVRCGAVFLFIGGIIVVVGSGSGSAFVVTFLSLRTLSLFLMLGL